MAFHLAELIILCLLADWTFRRLRLPGLVGMLAVGVLLGPYVLNHLSDELLAVGVDLRLIALVVILLRVGFALSRATLHRVGGRVLLLAFIPAIMEGIAITLMAPRLLGLTYLESALLGSVVAAVSPAVIVPAMIGFIRRNMGAAKDIPSMVMASASVDDVFVIVAHSVLLGLYIGGAANPVWQLAGIPVSLFLGGGVGLAIGALLCRWFDRFNPRATKRVLVIIALAILLLRLEQVLAAWVPFAGLVSAMAIGFMILERRELMAHELSAKLAKIWVFAEIVLFAMVGAQVNIGVAWQAGLAGFAVIGVGLLARSGAVSLCLLGSRLDMAERCFVVVSYLPKATVQAAIGAAPLLAMRAAGLDTGPGELILAIAVLSIVLTAPVGAWAIAFVGERVLEPAPATVHDALDAALESHAGEEHAIVAP